MNNDDFFNKLDNKSTGKDNSDKKNIYQIVAIVLTIFGIVGSFIISIEETCGDYSICEQTLNFGILIIGFSTSLISGLFMYGFGEIIRQLKLTNNQLANKKYEK
ncbi:MAG: hypothetical protein PHQ64_00885 [Bacilli bacterium]|nr:hypothetical protein [Bacilli bacterium]